MEITKKFNRTACLTVAALALGVAACAHNGQPASQDWADSMTSRRVNAQLKE
jgi:hypothetical protein